MNENKKPEPKDTEQALRDALDEQAKHFTGAHDPLPPDVDEAFWQANHAVLKALREHEASKGDDNPSPS